MITFSEELTRWLSDDPSREALMIKEAPVSKTTLMSCTKGYQPHARTMKAMKEVMVRFPLEMPSANRKQAVG